MKVSNAHSFASLIHGLAWSGWPPYTQYQAGLHPCDHGMLTFSSAQAECTSQKTSGSSPEVQSLLSTACL